MRVLLSVTGSSSEEGLMISTMILRSLQWWKEQRHFVGQVQTKFFFQLLVRLLKRFGDLDFL